MGNEEREEVSLSVELSAEEFERLRRAAAALDQDPETFARILILEEATRRLEAEREKP